MDHRERVIAELLPTCVAQLRAAQAPLPQTVLVIGDLRDDRFGFQFGVFCAHLADKGLSAPQARELVRNRMAEGGVYIGQALHMAVVAEMLMRYGTGDHVAILLAQLAHPAPDGHLRVLWVERGIAFQAMLPSTQLN